MSTQGLFAGDSLSTVKVIEPEPRSSTFVKYEGNGFTDYHISDWHGPRGSIRVEEDGSIQFTPSVTYCAGHDCNHTIGTLWVSPGDPAYSEIMANLQRVLSVKVAH